MKKVLSTVILSAVVLGCFSTGAALSKEPEPGDAYIFTSFRGNGENGLHLACSRDGLKWTALNDDKPYLAPKVGGRLMRDPCIIQGPDGLFHMVWTSSWRDKGIGVAHSKDLINWTAQKFVPVMKHEPTAQNCWAPEITWDGDGKQYVIYWATTIGRLAKGPEKITGHRIYCTTTKDFKEYSKTKLFFDPGFNVIDSTIVKDGGKYVMILKDERNPGKNLSVSTSDKVTGPWSRPSKPFSPKGLWVEGATCLKVNRWWYVYYDAYRKHRYGAMRTKDFKSWENVTDKLEVPKGMRHGTVLTVSSAVLDKLLGPKAEPKSPLAFKGVWDPYASYDKNIKDRVVMVKRPACGSCHATASIADGKLHLVVHRGRKNSEWTIPGKRDGETTIFQQGKIKIVMKDGKLAGKFKGMMEANINLAPAADDKDE